MQDVRPKWRSKGLVLICERCYRERIPEEDPEAAARLGGFALRDWIKARLKEDGRWGPIRAVGTTCMDVCARRRVTVAVESERGEARVFVVDPLDDKDALYARIVGLLEDPPEARA